MKPTIHSFGTKENMSLKTEVDGPYITAVARITQALTAGNFVKALEESHAIEDRRKEEIWGHQITVASRVERALRDRDPRRARSEAEKFRTEQAGTLLMRELIEGYRKRIECLSDELGEAATHLVQNGHPKRAKRVAKHLPKEVRKKVRTVIQGQGSGKLTTEATAPQSPQSETVRSREDATLDALITLLRSWGKELVLTEQQNTQLNALLPGIADEQIRPDQPPPARTEESPIQEATEPHQQLGKSADIIVAEIDACLMKGYWNKKSKKKPPGLNKTESSLLRAIIDAQQKCQPPPTLKALCHLTGLKECTVKSNLRDLRKFRINATPYRLIERADGFICAQRPLKQEAAVPTKDAAALE